MAGVHESKVSGSTVNVSVRWQPPDWLIEFIDGVSDRFDDFSVPLNAVAKQLRDDVKDTIAQGGRNIDPWPSPVHDPDTTKRHGSHAPLRLSDGLWNAIWYRAYSHSASAFAAKGHASLLDSYGRKPIEGEQGEMGVYPFMYVLDETADWGVEKVLDYLFEEATV